MPVYDFKCPDGHIFESIAPTGDFRLECAHCHQLAEKVWTRRSLPFMRGDYEPYDCPITGKRITGKAEHEANLKKHGCRVSEPGDMQAEVRRRAELDRKADEANDAIIDRVCGEFESN